MEFSTLRGRLVDAINTIIRLDESTETGDFLQPCIEGNLKSCFFGPPLHPLFWGFCFDHLC